MSDLHDVFHVSQLKRCLRVLEEQAPMEAMDLQPDLHYQERPIKILDTVTRQTRRTADEDITTSLHTSQGEEEV